MDSFWKNKKVLITGHTGFKGSWLALILNELGADITGYALEPSTNPNLFQLADVNGLLDSYIGDVRNSEKLSRCVQKTDPEIIFHMAAQAIVRESYLTPRDTFEVNAMGTVNILEAARNCKQLKVLVNITTDKCYENIEGDQKVFHEKDKLGGYDPYAASKACSELITAAYRQSFFENNVAAAIATARGGNVIGGGDWGKSRLLPDFFRAIENGKPFSVRNPSAIRPWQHVMDALNGYMSLAEKLYTKGHIFASAWNIGPDVSEFRTVQYLVERIINKWENKIECQFLDTKTDLHEASFLALDCSKARKKLSWNQKLNTEQAIDQTIEWFEGYLNGESSRELCLKQIREFFGE